MYKKIQLTMDQLKQNYWAPTPKKWRKFGDTLLILSQSLAGYSILMSHPYVGLTISLVGVLGKLITNFYSK